MGLLEKIKDCLGGKALPEHLRRGNLGEQAAKAHLRKLGLKFLTANFKSARGEIDLVFRDDDCLIPTTLKIRNAIQLDGGDTRNSQGPFGGPHNFHVLSFPQDQPSSMGRAVIAD